MPIQFLCSCGRKLQASEEHAGRRVRCPSCGAETTVPAGETAVQPAEASPSKPSPVQVEGPRRAEADDERDDDRRRRPSRRREEEDDDDRPRRRRREDDDDEEEDRPRRRRRREEDKEEEDDDRPRRPRGTSGKAIAALILGILSFCLGALSLLTAIPAIILAILSFGEIRRSRGRLGGKGLAIAGLVLACVGLVFSAFVQVYAVQRVREAVSSQHSRNNMMQMALAMHNYNDNYGHLPQATPDPKVQPATKLSWRVQLLPYLEQDNLWRQFRQDEPWDGPHNKALLTPMPKVFAHPNHPEDNAKGLTYYRVFVGPNTPFPPGKVSSIPASFPDGTSNTILIVEAADPVPWTKPDELAYDRNKPLPKLGGHFRGGTVAALADGSVVILHNGLSEQTLRSAIDPNDGLPLGADWP